MLDVHGVEVAGATFPVPIWHEYMAAALWHRKALPFELPNKYPTWHYLTRGSYGSFGYYPTSTYSTTTTAPTTTTTVVAGESGHDHRRTEDAAAHDDRGDAASHDSATPAGSDDDGVAATDDHRVAAALPWPSPVALSSPAR